MATIAELLLARGRSEGDARRRQGESSAAMWSNLGGMAANAITSYAQEKQDAPIRAQAAEMRKIELENAKAEQAAGIKATEDRSTLGSAMGMAQSRGPDAVKAQLSQLGRGDLIPIFDKTWTELESSRASLKKLKSDVAAAEADYFGSFAAGIKKAKYDPVAVNWALDEADADGHDTKEIREQLKANPQMLPTMVDTLIEKSPTQRKLLGEESDRALKTKQEERAIQAAAQASADKTADNIRADKTLAETERNHRAMEAVARLRANASAGNPNDVKDAVQGMMDGDIPPMLPGRASKDYLAVMGEAKRRGYDLASAATDWVATQKHISAMNSNQQLRLNQSINQLPELLDSVDELAKRWKGGRFPVLNKVNLAAAKNGAYGDEVASVARQLDTQIADVTADLGNVYMGGNSPTDHALKLAGTALNGDWSEKVLLDMTALARKNVKTRQNSIKNTGVQGASEDNPYAAPTVTATWTRDPKTGKLVKQ